MHILPYPPSAYCSDRSVTVSNSHKAAWNGWSPSPSNARYQSAEAAALTVGGVRKLKLKWARGFRRAVLPELPRGRSAHDPHGEGSEVPTYASNLPRTCGACHGNAAIAKKAGLPDVYSLYVDSIHGFAQQDGLLVAANCASCHGSHGILSSKDPKNMTNRANVPATCGTCHAGPLQAYSAGIHGPLTQAGDADAPVCTSCRTAHQLATYRETFHAQVSALGFQQVARCWDCHGNHDILPASDPNSMVTPAHLVTRYAYWDKLDYRGVFWGMGIIGLSGYAMWFGSFFARLIPGSWLNIALVPHAEKAILATGWIFRVHFFNTHLRPENYPVDLTIFTGRLSEEELQRMHPEEYAHLVNSGGLQAIATDPPPDWLKTFGRVIGTTAVLAGVTMLIFMAVAFLKG